MKFIGRGAFFECEALESIIIPNSVDSIDYWAFRACNSLQNVYCYAETVPSSKTDIFEDTPIETATLHVPAASIEAYKAAEPWKNFKKIVALDEKPKCDVNGDNIVDVADIASIIDVMAAGDKIVEQVIAADVNGDGVVDVADIATIIDKMAGK